MNGAPRYFLTAYGIARKHGFEGSEEEWLDSLVGAVPVLTVERVDTLPAGAPAYVEITGEDPRYPGLIFGIPRGEGMEDALMTTGGIMRGQLDMSGNRLTGIPAPEMATDAINLEFAQQIGQAAADAQQTANDAERHAQEAQRAANDALPKSGGVMSGALAVLAPTQDNHPATRKYVNDLASNLYLATRVTLSAEGWTGDGPYTQSVAVEGMRYTDRPHYGVRYSEDLTTALAEKEAFALVDDLDSGDGSVTFTCFEEKPGVDLTVQLEVNR